MPPCSRLRPTRRRSASRVPCVIRRHLRSGHRVRGAFRLALCNISRAGAIASHDRHPSSPHRYRRRPADTASEIRSHRMPSFEVMHPNHFAYRHIGPRQEDVAEMVKILGYGSLDDLHRRRGAGGHPPAPAARPAAGPRRARGAAGAARHGRPEPDLPLLHRHGVLRHLHAAGDPAEHPGESRLVHRLHAVPGRDRPGPPGGAAQLPDDGGGPDRPADRQRLAARRGHRRRRGDGADPRGRTAARRHAGVPGGRRLPSADHRRGADPRRGAGRRRGGGRSPEQFEFGPGVIGCLVQYPATDGAHPRLPRDLRGAPTPPGRWSPWPPTCWR